MALCRSWRPATDDSGIGIPDERGRGFKPCLRRVPAGVERCERCLAQLLGHPSAVVRQELARETNLPVDALESLLRDPDRMVVVLAAATLRASYPDHVATEVEPVPATPTAPAPIPTHTPAEDDQW